VICKPLTLLRRTWIIPMRGSRAEEDSWGIIPPAHVEVSGRAMGGAMDFEVTFNDKRVMLFEPKHPKFREWMQDFIDALQAALDAPCDVLSWAQEHFDAEEQKLRAQCEEPSFPGGSRFWDSEVELEQFRDGIPAGALPIWTEEARLSATIRREAMGDMLPCVQDTILRGTRRPMAR
jgi:hypothetical protein